MRSCCPRHLLEDLMTRKRRASEWVAHNESPHTGRFKNSRRHNPSHLLVQADRWLMMVKCCKDHCYNNVSVSIYVIYPIHGEIQYQWLLWQTTWPRDMTATSMAGTGVISECSCLWCTWPDLEFFRVTFRHVWNGSTSLGVTEPVSNCLTISRLLGPVIIDHWQEE